MRPLVRPSLGRRIALATAALAVMLATAAISTAARPSPARPVATRDVAQPSNTPPSASAIRRAAAIAVRLGLPTGTPSVHRLTEGFEHATYDEVTMADDRGRPVSLVRLAPEGTLALAARLGLHRNGRPVAEAAAIAHARSIARQAGATALGQPATTASHGSGGWMVVWPRIVDGVPVRGDGVRVGMWTDGTLHSFSRLVRPLAARPARTADAARATSAADAFVVTRFGADARSLMALPPRLAWVVPNDTWDGPRPDTAEPVARLAWVVEYRASGSVAGRIAAIEIWLDAGSLELVGGDVAE